MTTASQPDLKSLRVDQVGSLLRPQTLKEAFARYSAGAIKEDELRKAQDDAIRDVIAKQEAHHLPVVVDGEFRRTSFMESFSVVAGVEEWQPVSRPITKFWRARIRMKPLRIKGRIRSCSIASA
jgi:5-methyltetrahydropteroyltriglutamate--homocysteine methyltransferase